ncbi:MAG: hypothetical protein WBO09_12275 [Methylocystis silviterrae]|uniref:acyltransferase family protein n=1 Tax=Methylocystis silviterrae TaxID=2743612 RepID=UPI003C77AA8D
MPDSAWESPSDLQSQIRPHRLVLYFFGHVEMALVGAAAILVILFVELPRYRMLHFLGAISYSLYLLHVPIGGRVVNLGQRFGGGEIFYLVLSLTALFVCILAAATYWRFIESPAHRLAKTISLKAPVDISQSRGGKIRWLNIFGF